uniref:Hansenula polymorpha MOX methanol oxidase n=1 Tax=Pichia angusta TaxID=870730 RepID=Q00920_PICAN|nr:hypothetical protein [Ogataea angusta]CAA26277.1 unnamed protein product [Ogataea angusta]
MEEPRHLQQLGRVENEPDVVERGGHKPAFADGAALVLDVEGLFQRQSREEAANARNQLHEPRQFGGAGFGHFNVVVDEEFEVVEDFRVAAFCLRVYHEVVHCRDAVALHRVQDERRGQQALDPFYEAISTVFLECVLHSVATGHLETGLAVLDAPINCCRMHPCTASF